MNLKRVSLAEGLEGAVVLSLDGNLQAQNEPPQRQEYTSHDEDHDEDAHQLGGHPSS